MFKRLGEVVPLFYDYYYLLVSKSDAKKRKKKTFQDFLQIQTWKVCSFQLTQTVSSFFYCIYSIYIYIFYIYIYSIYIYCFIGVRQTRTPARRHFSLRRQRLVGSFFGHGNKMKRCDLWRGSVLQSDIETSQNPIDQTLAETRKIFFFTPNHLY